MMEQSRGTSPRAGRDAEALAEQFARLDEEFGRGDPGNVDSMLSVIYGRDHLAQRRSGASRAQEITDANQVLGTHPNLEHSQPGDRHAKWISWYRKWILLGDVASAVVGSVAGYLVRIDNQPIRDTHYALCGLLLPVLWILLTIVSGCIDSRIVGIGEEEFQRLLRAFISAVALVGLLHYIFDFGIPRSYVAVALPGTFVLSGINHYVTRRRLSRARLGGRFATSVIVVGDADSVADLSERIHAELHLGMRIIGACVPRVQLNDPIAIETMGRAGVYALGDLDAVVSCVKRSGADVVAVTSSRDIGPRRLRELSWDLESTEADLVVAPGLIEVAGPRLHIRPVIGLPLLQVDKPEFDGGKRLVKVSFDRIVAFAGLFLLAPVLIGVALAIRLTSRGPIFFRQTRVGKGGREFKIWKFRSMYTDAESRLAQIRDLNENADGLLFRMREDPRVTRVGRYIRRYSLDELPQLFNVLNGTMSLVGPRPPLPSEVAAYGSDVGRRLLVRPGLTGLWQVSGRSDLSWEESVRLDLRYVENWSLGQDALILWKTAAAVVRGSGAY